VCLPLKHLEHKTLEKQMRAQWMKELKQFPQRSAVRELLPKGRAI
jgi:hypothetical protein